MLETDFETAEGAVRLIDFMPRRVGETPQLVRIVEGLRGRVPMRMELALRPDYAAIVPWVESVDDGALAQAGPDAFHLSTPLELRTDHDTTVAEFTAIEGARQRFVLSWHASYQAAASIEDAESALARTEAWWRAWSGRCAYDGEYRDEVLTSLITLKATTHEVTGAVVAAPTTSLPEDIGGVRNWDDRYCWLRDSALTLNALLAGGYTEEALAFSEYAWRVGTGEPSKLQIMYGVAGERRLTEFELDELPGYEGSNPVRIGNAASEQFQLDVYGEIADVVFVASEHLGRPPDPRDRPRFERFLEHVEEVWDDPDDGIWEGRGPRRHFTHSKVMAWAALDRSARMAERYGLDAPADRWRRVCRRIHDDVCEHGYDPRRNTFTQYYGSKELDSSTLLIPIVGFLPGDDDRVTGTIDAVRSELDQDGLVARYSTTETDDGPPGTEGQFLACSFCLVSALALNGRVEEARTLFELVVGLSNDVGLLAEEYDVPLRRQVRDFPQAFSHLALIQAAGYIDQAAKQ